MTTCPFTERLQQSPRLIGMVHLAALPGTPAASESPAAIVARAVAEARVYRDHGIDTVVVENMHDVPYTRQPGPEITAMMTRAATEIRAVGLCVGIQVLASANREALAVALASGAEFVRVEGFVYAHVADEGFTDACAGELLRYRRHIGAESIAVLADIKKKHCSHAITADVSLAETARTAAYFRADGVVVTGIRSGSPVCPEDLRAARSAVSCPVLVGSGATPEALAAVAPSADGIIVGSYVKVDGCWSNPLDVGRLDAMVRCFAELPRPVRGAR